MSGRIELTADRLVRLPPPLTQWCMVVEFAVVDGACGDGSLIEAVIAHPRYRDHCAGPFDGQGHHGLHGPFRAEAITVDAFRPTTAAEVLGTLARWTSERLPPEHAAVGLECREVVDAWLAPVLVEATAIHRLTLDRAGNEHDWGWVVGVQGFHEYLAIDRRRSRVSLIIATDD